MNVRSKFDTDDSELGGSRKQYMRGGCGAPYNLASGPGRLDVSMLRVPRFISSGFRSARLEDAFPEGLEVPGIIIL